MCSCVDRDNFRNLISDVAHRRMNMSDGATDAGKNINNMIDAALALNVDEDTMVADLMTVFIGGFHTSASRESTVDS